MAFVDSAVIKVTLDKIVEFKTVLQRGNRIQIPKLVRWEFKIEPSQVLRVHISFGGNWRSMETFYAQISKDGRITVPKLVCSLLKEFCKGNDVAGKLLAVELSPSEEAMTRETDNEE